MISEIKISHTLPLVFHGMETNPAIAQSQVWLRDITFNRGSFYLIQADSGTGKSSLCSFIYGLRGDYSGSIEFDGTPTRSYSIARWCQLHSHALAYLPQEMQLFPELTVIENIEIKNRLTHHKSAQWIHQTLQELDLETKLQQKACFLSVGQQQRVAIVRALCQPFDFLLLDEPVSHLDPRNNTLVASIIAREAKSLGAAVIATSVGNHIDLPFDHTLHL